MREPPCLDILITLVNQRLALLESQDLTHLAQALKDAVTHETMRLLDLREWLANHAES